LNFSSADFSRFLSDDIEVRFAFLISAASALWNA
jgi:hypothetical protein